MSFKLTFEFRGGNHSSITVSDIHQTINNEQMIISVKITNITGHKPSTLCEWLEVRSVHVAIHQLWTANL